MKAHVLACTIAAVATIPGGAVLADADGIVGGVIGGIIGGVIGSQTQKQPQVQTRTVYKTVQPKAPAAPSPTTIQNRQVQEALNYFGFPAGVADGVMGARSQAAVSGYQGYMGFAPTGQLTDFERSFLLQSHMMAQAGGFATQQLVATLPDGTRGLLHQYRNQQIQMAGGAVPMAPMPAQPQMAFAQPAPVAPAGPTTVVVNTAPVQPQAPQPAPVQAVAAVAAPPPPVPAETPQKAIAGVAAAAAPIVVPNFMADQAEASVTSFCNMVSLRTSSNGGFVTKATLSDPKVALDEQFCLARTFAIARGEELMQRVKGVNPADIEVQCKLFGPLLKDHVAALSFKDPNEVMKEVGDFVLSTGVAPTQLKGTAEICLAVGYRTDDLDVTLGSALMLTVLGERPYAEVMGHHLVQGFGTSQRTDLALAWYGVGLSALEGGATPVFAATLPERTQLMEVSVSGLAAANGGAPVEAIAPAPAPQAGGVPAFAISQ